MGVRPGTLAMSRRRFLKGMAGILATGLAPAVLPSGIIMPVRELWVPEWTGELVMGWSCDAEGAPSIRGWRGWLDKNGKWYVEEVEAKVIDGVRRGVIFQMDGA